MKCISRENPRLYLCLFPFPITTDRSVFLHNNPVETFNDRRSTLWLVTEDPYSTLGKVNTYLLSFIHDKVLQNVTSLHCLFSTGLSLRIGIIVRNLIHILNYPFILHFLSSPLTSDCKVPSVLPYLKCER